MTLATLATLAVLSIVLGAIAGALAALAAIANAGPVATAEMLAEVSRLKLEWDAWRKGAEGVLESVEDVENVIERKRRRVAARESIEKRREAGPGGANGGESDPRAALRARARSLGHPV